MSKQNRIPIPAHLKRYVVNQHYEKYTPINQAVWRYVMRQNRHFLKDTAHSAYIEGLSNSGINIDSIPKIEEMNECLKPFGWGAVTIDGYIPGVVFFDFQAHGILPIAADIRQIDHIEYTPAPDIIHEAAGHAPILCDPKYAEYVRIFGEIGAKAIATKEEHDVFEAIRNLSALLESGEASVEEIKHAREHLEAKQKSVTTVSEAEQISRLYWWTVEYGMIGSLEEPRIYGAGLLSSVGESAHSLTENVKKIPFDLETAIQTGFDITTMQPQLFVCKSFDELIAAVKDFSKRMAFRKGGTESLFKALNSANTVNITLSSGLQISGTVSQVHCDDQGKAICFQTTGSTAFSIKNKDLTGHNKERHPNGIIAPIGLLKGKKKAIEKFSEDELHEIQLMSSKTCQLEFEGGLIIKGIVKEVLRKNKKVILISFLQGEVSLNEKIIIDMNSGPFDLPVGECIISVAAGAADPESFYADSVSASEQPSPWKGGKEGNALETLYAQVRMIRENNHISRDRDSILQIIQELNAKFSNDWLLRLEILELISVQNNEWKETANELVDSLQKLKEENPDLTRLITNGLKLIP